MLFRVPFDPHWFLRLAMGSVFLYHGLTKQPASFAKAFNLSYLVAVLVILAEIAGGFGYLWGGFNDFMVKNLGYLTVTQLASLAVIPVLLGAIYLVHWQRGFNAMKGGYEFQLVLLLIALYFLYR